MRIAAIAVAAIALAGCGGSSQSIVGSWLYVNSYGTSGIGATFNADGTYEAGPLLLTSMTSADAQVETGTYDATNGALTTVPEKSSCPGPDPISSVPYSISGGSLELTTPTGIIGMKADSEPAAQNFSLTFGCFDSSGSFTPSPLAPVSN